MTDEGETDDGGVDPNEYQKHTVRRLGERGTPILDEEEKTTDLENMTEEVEETVFSFCNCGAPHTQVEEIYRCCACDEFCCSRCRILIRHYNYCPNCVQVEYGIDKPVFKALYLLDEEILSQDDLFHMETVDDEVVEIRIEAVAERLLDAGYLLSDDNGEGEELGRLGTDDVLSAEGLEALHIGEQLFGEDPDIAEMKDRVKIKQVTGDD